MRARITLGIVAALLVLGIGSIVTFFHLVGAPGPNPNPVTVTIATGTSAQAIATQLHEAGVLSRPFLLTTYATLEGARDDFVAGTFTLPERVSVRKVLDILTTLPDASEVTVRVPESATARDIAALLEQAEVIPSSEFLEAVSTTDSRTIAPDRTYDFLRDKPQSATLEGYLFPDTYRFYTDATAAHVVRKFLDTFESKVSSEILANIRSSGRTVFEVVTLASIVDREVRTDRDRRLAAGLFWKRLEIGMALQSDATVNYVTGKQELQPSASDLTAESPYNTYKYPGLPPGPIGNPSLSAIRATANPEASEYLYFLHAPDGTTYFSATYAEHLTYKAKYLD